MATSHKSIGVMTGKSSTLGNVFDPCKRSTTTLSQPLFEWKTSSSCVIHIVQQLKEVETIQKDRTLK
jgi:hypothetical protein